MVVMLESDAVDEKKAKCALKQEILAEETLHDKMLG